jgi:hypothetical protein
MKRHESNERSSRDGKKCPHCDYVCLQPSYLREHIRLHFEANTDRKASVFRNFTGIEIYAQRSSKKESIVFFKDLGPEVDLRTRFEPNQEDDEFINMFKDVMHAENNEGLPTNALTENDGLGFDDEADGDIAENNDLDTEESQLDDLGQEVEVELNTINMEDCEELVLDENDLNDSYEEQLDFEDLEDVVEVFSS